MDLQDETHWSCCGACGASQPELRLMIIPLDCATEEVLQLGIQGTLSQAVFPARHSGTDRSGRFCDPLVYHISSQYQRRRPSRAPPAVRQPESAAPGSTAAPVSRPERATAPTRLRAPFGNAGPPLDRASAANLARELNADAVLLTYGSELVAYAGRFGLAEAEQLARVVVDSWQASARVAAALGREKVRFEQSLHEGQDYLLYSLSAADEIVSVSRPARRPSTGHDSVQHQTDRPRASPPADPTMINADIYPLADLSIRALAHLHICPFYAFADRPTDCEVTYAEIGSDRRATHWPTVPISPGKRRDSPPAGESPLTPFMASA